MKRPTAATAAGVLTFFGAILLALGSCAFFVVGLMVATGDEARAPVSVAIAGMALAGALLQLILALAAGLVAQNIVELRDWARTISLTEIADSARESLLRIFASIAALRRDWFADFVSSHRSRRIEHHPSRRI
jgi:hypothetical protein